MNMQFKNEESKKLWENSVEKTKDPYDACIYSYAEKWALMMELKIKEGEKLSDIAHQTSREADTEGITGYMYGVAVNRLCQTWVHGDELRKWHNAKYGIKDDTKAAVNPAIINL